MVAYDIARDLGHPALAVDAAQRGHDAASLLDDDALLGFASWYRAQSLMGVGAHRRASATLTAGIDRMESAVDPTDSDTRASQAYGFLHLTAALHAARQARPQDAHDHLHEAANIATRTGEQNWLRHHFGPTNVGLWTASIGVELGEAARVVERAADVDPRALDSPDREGWLHFDLARALSQEGGHRDREAIEHLDQADRIAPTLIRHNPLARSLLESLDSRARLQTWELTSLRNRFGLAGTQG